VKPEVLHEKLQIKWKNVPLLVYIHIAAVYAFFLPFKWTSFVINVLFLMLVGFGVTVAAHRFFTHKTFNANKKLRFLLVMLQTMSAQKPVLLWVRDHRVHHKFTDTSADPHDSRRGFFFSHVGWLMCKKHRDVIEGGKTIDMSDLENDPMLKFQQK
jgi:stearoyl-CoA desaturase (delta-9 desaturase)